MSGHATPYHCPFCGEGDLWPHENLTAPEGDQRGAWECRSCLRAFSLKALGLVRPASGAGSR